MPLSSPKRRRLTSGPHVASLEYAQYADLMNAQWSPRVGRILARNVTYTRVRFLECPRRWASSKPVRGKAAGQNVLQTRNIKDAKTEDNSKYQTRVKARQLARNEHEQQTACAEQRLPESSESSSKSLSTVRYSRSLLDRPVTSDSSTDCSALESTVTTPAEQHSTQSPLTQEEIAKKRSVAIKYTTGLQEDYPTNEDAAVPGLSIRQAKQFEKTRYGQRAHTGEHGLGSGPPPMKDPLSDRASRLGRKLRSIWMDENLSLWDKLRATSRAFWHFILGLVSYYLWDHLSIPEQSEQRPKDCLQKTVGESEQRSLGLLGVTTEESNQDFPPRNTGEAEQGSGSLLEWTTVESIGEAEQESGRLLEWTTVESEQWSRDLVKRLAGDSEHDFENFLVSKHGLQKFIKEVIGTSEQEFKDNLKKIAGELEQGLQDFIKKATEESGQVDGSYDSPRSPRMDTSGIVVACGFVGAVIGACAVVVAQWYRLR